VLYLADTSRTAPFNISDLGSIHLKITKASQRQKLLRIDILAEQSTIFLHISMETKNWPFSIRNESRVEFTFYQAVSGLVRGLILYTFLLMVVGSV